MPDSSTPQISVITFPETIRRIADLMEALQELKPYLNDRANYFGIYEESVVKVCKLMGWSDSDT